MHSKGNLKTRHVRIALVMMIPNKNKTIPMRTQLIRLTSSSPTKGRVDEYMWPTPEKAKLPKVCEYGRQCNKSNPIDTH